MATVTRRLAALLGASGAGLTDSATASKITTDSINDDAVNAAKIAANAVGTSEVADNVLTATDLAANSVGESELSVDYTAQSVPHIVPGVLHPAVDGKGIDGTTTITSFGTDVAISGFPTLKYYYTNIKGSKPIKDPRIGAHFGSQRHKIKSIQILEKETATHGKNVYSIDGREWMRAVGNELSVNYANSGSSVKAQSAAAGSFIEVVGYFLDANLLNELHTADRNLTVQVNGSSAVAFNDFTNTVGSPLEARYVDEMAVVNIDLPTKNSASLGINTLRINFVAGSYPRISGIDLIAQDLTGSGSPNRSKIKIHAQNVVSFGKKFPIAETNHHYDPFSAKTDGSAWTSPTSGTNNANSAASWPTNIDTTHSLGLDKWVDGSNYYRPYNGGRVVKYVDSTGTIKTAVTVMPPNAKSIKSEDINKKAKNAGNTTYLPTFEDETTSVNEDELHEVAKTFLWREFGNGSANGGTGGVAYPDASMLNASTDIAYVMDDGLTSLVGDDVYHWQNQDMLQTNEKYYHITFIGTGISVDSNSYSSTRHLAQNLPYGTHILRAKRHDSQTWDAQYDIDGVAINGHASQYPALNEVTFYQPKRPPIPEDACVIADYMLVADFVPQTAADWGNISKGVITKHNSRDFYYNGPSGTTMTTTVNISAMGSSNPYQYIGNVAGTHTQKIPYFGTSFTQRFNTVSTYTITTGSTYTVNGSNLSSYTVSAGGSGQSAFTSAGVLTKVAGNHEGFASAKGGTLGNNIFSVTETGASGKYSYFGPLDVATPIHTSHHYQSFETPYLRELVGGDRNMEQTNLVCSPDGKTWDEMSRDTSYIGKSNTSINRTNNTVANSSNVWIFDECRGQIEGKILHNKDWAIAYDRMICLVGGDYQISWQQHMSNVHSDILINDSGTNHQHVCRMHSFSYSGNAVNGGQSVVFNFNFERGDTIQLKGGYSHGTQGEDLRYQNFQISRL